MNIIKDLIKLADHLDKAGDSKRAAIVDSIIKKYADFDPEELQEGIMEEFADVQTLRDMEEKRKKEKGIVSALEEKDLIQSDDFDKNVYHVYRYLSDLKDDPLSGWEDPYREWPTEEWEEEPYLSGSGKW